MGYRGGPDQGDKLEGCTVNKNSRMAMLLVVALMVTLFAGAAHAKTIKMKLAGISPTDFYVTQSLYRIAERVEKESGGEMKIKVFPMNQLGDYEQVFEEVRRGSIEMACVFLSGRFDKKLEMNSLPYLATNFEEVNRIFFDSQSPYVQELDRTLDGLGVKYLGSFSVGFMGMMFTKGKKPDNLFDFENKGIKIRVPGLSIYRDTVREVGYQTATIPYSEAYSSMQTGVVDGGSGQCPEIAYHVFKDVIRTFATFNMFFEPDDFVMNKKLWESLSPEQQKIIQDAVRDEAMASLEKAEENGKLYKAELQEFGVEVVEVPDDVRAAYAERIRTNVWPKYAEIFGASYLEELVDFMDK